MAKRHEEMARSIVNDFYGSKVDAVERIAALLARVEREALERACVAACTICGEECPAEGPDGGGLYWHMWSPPGEPSDDYPCEASAIRALLTEEG